MPEPGPVAPARRSAWSRALAAGVILLLLVCAGLVGLHLRRLHMERRLLSLPPMDVAAHPDLVRFAAAEARPLFRDNCAACHGADMKGRTAAGAPDLTDDNWLYGDGSVFEIERTILYGVRSGHGKSHDLTEMPAFGQRGQLSPADIRNVVQLLLKLNDRPYDAQAASLGQAVYNGSAACFDCHGADAKGDPDYGAPDLTANAWDWGGDPRTLYDSIYYGRHGMMPAWIGKLSPAQIRALAVYIHSVSAHG